MTRRSRFAALVAVAALAVAGCSNNDAKKSDIVNAMADAGLNDDQSQCVADGIYDEYGDDQDTLNDIASASEPSEFPDDTQPTIEGILDDCLGSSPASGAPGDSTTTTEAGDTGDTTTTTAAGG
jgi:hypothetical protein